MAHHGTFIDHLTRVHFNTNYMVTRGNKAHLFLIFNF
jgi:hypothetical protein